MTRSKLSPKVVLLAGGIGLSIAAFAGSQPAAAQSYSDAYSCPAGTAYDPTYGCTLAGDAYEPYDYGYYGYLPYTTFMDLTMAGTANSLTASAMAWAAALIMAPVLPTPAVAVSAMAWPAASGTAEAAGTARAVPA